MGAQETTVAKGGPQLGHYPVRVRAHTFSYEQCNPPPGTIAIVASLFVERASGGISLRSLILEIEESVSAHNDLVLKLHEVVAATLGTSLNEALSVRFDTKLPGSSLRLYSLNDVPAIRGPLPPRIIGDLTAYELWSGYIGHYTDTPFR